MPDTGSAHSRTWRSRRRERSTTRWLPSPLRVGRSITCTTTGSTTPNAMLARVIRLEQEPGAVLESFYLLVMTRVYAGTMRSSSEERDDAIEAARAIEDPFLQCMANSCIAGWFFAVNASEEGIPFAEEAMRLATDLGNPVNVEHGPVPLGRRAHGARPANARGSSCWRASTSAEKSATTSSWA